MSMLDALASLSPPDPVTAPFWEACRRRELRFQRCAGCGRFRHPPLFGCPACGSSVSTWERVSGRGTIFSYTVAHHAAVPPLATDVPYVVLVVEFYDAPGVRLISNLREGPHADLRVGCAVDLAWDEVSADVILPRFQIARP
jgi:uncharacterized OB-fold protein